MICSWSRFVPPRQPAQDRHTRQANGHDPHRRRLYDLNGVRRSHVNLFGEGEHEMPIESSRESGTGVDRYALPLFPTECALRARRQLAKTIPRV